MDACSDVQGHFAGNVVFSKHMCLGTNSLLSTMGKTFGPRFLWSVLLLSVFYTFGCLTFFYLEREVELKSYSENYVFQEQMEDLYAFEHCKDPAFQQLTFCQKQADFSISLKRYFNQHGNSVKDLQQWTIVGTMFFLTHLTTTIGYGNSHPQTQLGRAATIFFALVGIPIMGYTLAQMARLDLKVSVFILEKVGCKEASTLYCQQLVLWSQLMLFLFGGAYVYTMLEPWTYFESLYFCFVTLSTVGIGDKLPSSSMSKAFSILYMISGLGVCASIIALLTGLVAEGHAGVDAFLSRSNFAPCLNVEEDL